MNYTETLKLKAKYDIDAQKLYIADVCEGIFDFDYTNDEFNQLCEFVDRINGVTDKVRVDEIAFRCKELLTDEYEPLTIAELISQDVIEFAKQFNYYID